MAKNKIAYFLEGLWLPIHANLDGLWHRIRGHKVEWFSDPDLWCGHLGFLTCHECPDCEGADLCIWGFYFHRVHRLGQFLCGLGGHKGISEWMTHTSPGSDELIGTGKFHCPRCLADMPAPSI